jgi:hypothetical protein
MIFPDWGETPSTEDATAALPLLTEWAVDWKSKRFAQRNGDFYTVTGVEALKIWVDRALRTESQRFWYTAWSTDYGNELAGLLGGVTDQGILESLLRQYIREALLVSPYISEVDGFSFSKQGSRVTVACTVHSVYETFTQWTEVQLG